MNGFRTTWCEYIRIVTTDSIGIPLEEDILPPIEAVRELFHQIYLSHEC
jgi:hypothetical protein